MDETVSDNYLFFQYFSDLTIRLEGQEVKGHRFVLAARSDNWGVSDLACETVLDLSGW